MLNRRKTVTNAKFYGADPNEQQLIEGLSSQYPLSQSQHQTLHALVYTPKASNTSLNLKPLL